MDIFADYEKYVLLTSEDINEAELAKDRNAEDSHLYEVVKNNGLKRIKDSCCGKFNLKSSKAAASYNIKSSASMREFCAKEGRSICGSCVSALYSNRDSEE